VSLNKFKSQCKAVAVTVNSQEENSYICLDFVQEFGLRSLSDRCLIYRMSVLSYVPHLEYILYVSVPGLTLTCHLFIS
jgi:hypothetical protein